MPNVIISDSSCLILLEKLEEIDLLQQIYGEILVTPEVSREVLFPLPEWMKIRASADKLFQAQLERRFGAGESSSIALATEIVDALLIIDDQKAKQQAKALGLMVTGTLGILLEAKSAGIIQSIKPHLEKIRRTNFHIDNKLESLILRLANE